VGVRTRKRIRERDEDWALQVDLARLVVGDIASDELAVFDETAEEYRTEPMDPGDPPRRDETLGFGVDLALVTPYALAVAGWVVQFLGSVATDIAKDTTKPVAQSLVRRMLIGAGGRSAERQPVVLSREQLTAVRESSYAQACALGLKPERAALLADAVVGSINRGAA
jgi:hypothetical protein